MKSEFSKSWKSSKQPRKQVKFRANAPLHIKRKFLSSSLDKVLRKKYEVRTIGVRKGDEVKIMRGKFAKKSGKVSIVDVKNTRVQIDGVQRAKKGGEKLETWFHPSNIKIVLLDDSDNRRMKNLKRVDKTKTKKAEDEPEKVGSKEKKNARKEE